MIDQYHQLVSKPVALLGPASDSKQDSQSSIDNGDDHNSVVSLLPVALQEGEERVREHSEETLDVLPLRPGAYLWDVHVGGHHERWKLDYPYGEFPLSHGDRFRYRDKVYTVQSAWTNMVAVMVEVVESLSA